MNVRILIGLCVVAVCIAVVAPGVATAQDGKLKPLVDFRGKLADPRQGLNPELFTKSALWLDHTAGYMIPKLMYHDTHPEYFAMRRDGTRQPKTVKDSYVHLCMSNPDVQRIATERVLGWMRKQPNKRYFCITQGDGPDWCQCEKCKAMDVEPGNYSDRNLKFMNHIARAVQKEFPDNILLGLAYCGTDEPPAKVRPEKNVWMMYCPYWGVALSEVHPLTHPVNAEALRQLEGWLKMAPNNMAIYDYNMYYCPSWDAMAEKLKWYSAKGIRGVWFCGAPSNFRGLFNYMTRNGVMRDPNRDPEALKRQFVTETYGPAAPHVMKYLTLHKKRLQKGYPRGIHDHCMPAAYYTDDNFGQTCLELFDKMIEAAKGTRAEGSLKAERKRFADDMKAALAAAKRKGKYNPTKPEKLDNGVRLPAKAWTGGRGPMGMSWFCPKRTAMIVYTPKSPWPSDMQAAFTLDAAPAGGATLKIEAQNSDKDLPPSTPIRITINGKQVFQGPCKFPPRGWAWRTFDVPAGVLAKGRNTIRIENQMDSARLDHYWVAVSEVQVLFK